MEFKIGDIIETFDGLKGEITSLLTNTAVVDFSVTENYSEHFEDAKQVVRLNDIRQIINS
ncbi:MAG: DUF2187 domain-containing protein [Bacillota bacterium]|jgi:uncharacterized protein YkvS|uniref:Uncharacterized protein n=4 Tax=Fictibacillus TaxID=1329200 RepID=A0A160IQU9_9BACL|nr:MULTISPECIES: DUF2187 domain-containing protein [Bacillaceae]ANC78863.1 hypothetical protein ABE65_019480 [Fictibacillus phosphorivorans]MBD7964965.1 DUF2187 domain-containing protein [Fictibacillus norfolkensis]MBH0156538.1 DUF2187 domain-containing protein [Fictibacillus sp. 5RED26]MBH0161919.1 DUF2187 domain-containing protein [Fictibacillus sp. 26RED30]MBH0164279.1 DUF2187 domain-containing protein [Fictibacillus sp. 7GRE50]